MADTAPASGEAAPPVLVPRPSTLNLPAPQVSTQAAPSFDEYKASLMAPSPHSRLYQVRIASASDLLAMDRSGKSDVRPVGFSFQCI